MVQLTRVEMYFILVCFTACSSLHLCPFGVHLVTERTEALQKLSKMVNRNVLGKLLSRKSLNDDFIRSQEQVPAL